MPHTRQHGACTSKLQMGFVDWSSHPGCGMQSSICVRLKLQSAGRNCRAGCASAAGQTPTFRCRWLRQWQKQPQQRQRQPQQQLAQRRLRRLLLLHRRTGLAGHDAAALAVAVSALGSKQGLDACAGSLALLHPPPAQLFSCRVLLSNFDKPLPPNTEWAACPARTFLFYSHLV